MLEGTAEDAQRAEGEAQVQGDREARETKVENIYRDNLAQEVLQGPPRERPRVACSLSPQWDRWLPAEAPWKDWGLQTTQAGCAGCLSSGSLTF